MVSFRKSFRGGPFRFTVSKSGVSLSGGVPGARVSVNSKGQAHRTLGIPGTGLYDRKRLGDKSPREAAGLAEGQHVELQALDAKGPGRALLDGQANIAYLKVVEASPNDAADLAGLDPTAAWVRGIRDGVLLPQGDNYRVLMMMSREDNPRLFGRKDDDTPKAVDVGRLGKADLRKWSRQFAGRTVYVAVYVDATPGLDGLVEVRFYPERLAEDFQEPEPEVSPQSAYNVPKVAHDLGVAPDSQ